jgi:hypothetical protein
LYFLTTLYVDVKEPAPKFFGVNSPHISDEKKLNLAVRQKSRFRFPCRDKIESNLQSQMYKNRLLIRGVPRLAGHQINERRGLVKSIFWFFLILRSMGSPSGSDGRRAGGPNPWTWIWCECYRGSVNQPDAFCFSVHSPGKIVAVEMFCAK